MGTFTAILIGLIIGLIIGAILGGFIVKRFNVTDYSISGKNRAKKGGVINFKPEMNTKEKPKLLKRIFTNKNK